MLNQLQLKGEIFSASLITKMALEYKNWNKPKRFKSTNNFDKKEEFDKNSLPDWLTHKDMKWFVDNHIMKLKIGEKTATEFHEIERIS